VTEPTILDDLHLGGIAYAYTTDKTTASDMVTHLMGCGHSHVFVVDQSRTAGSAGLVTLGISESGRRCLGLD
jgi:hypothetical protein